MGEKSYPTTFRSADRGGPGCMGTGGATPSPAAKKPSGAAVKEAEGKTGMGRKGC